LATHITTATDTIVRFDHQGKLFFYDLVADGVKVQIMVDPKTYGDEEAFKAITTVLR